MQQPSQAERKSPSLITLALPHSLWTCPWLPADRHTHDIRALQGGYQKQMVRLMLAAFVFSGSSAIQFLPDDCQTSFRFIPASRALSLAGLLTQLAFYHGVPINLPKAVFFLRNEETRSHGIVFFASLWIPFLPFALSLILLCFGTDQWACLNAPWQAST